MFFEGEVKKMNFPKVNLVDVLDDLVQRGIVESVVVDGERIYKLTEMGEMYAECISKSKEKPALAN
jgi:predicted transcriptional regulator